MLFSPTLPELGAEVQGAWGWGWGLGSIYRKVSDPKQGSCRTYTAFWTKRREEEEKKEEKEENGGS